MLEGNITMFDSLVKSAEIIQKIIPLDCCIMICNKEGLIVKFVGAESFDMNVREGSVVAKGGSLGECIATAKIVHKTIPKEAYNVPIKAIAVPIFDNNILIGGIAPTKCNGQKVFGTTYKVKSEQKDIKLKYES